MSSTLESNWSATELPTKRGQNEVPESYDAFFYGTLMYPRILNRVLFGYGYSSRVDTRHKRLTHSNAILYDHGRFKVIGCDYPGVVAVRDQAVQGVYTTGLTKEDMDRLDQFEGSHYKRVNVQVEVFDKIVEQENDLAVKDNEKPGPENSQAKIIGARGTGKTMTCQTYIFLDPKDLEEEEWDIESFTNHKMRYWTGSEGEKEYEGLSWAE